MLPGPLEYSWLKNSIRKHSDDKTKDYQIRCLLVDNVARGQSQSFQSYMLFYALALHRESVTFSWIQHLHEPDDTSVFLKLLQFLYYGDSSLPTWDAQEWEHLNWEEPTPSSEQPPNFDHLNDAFPSVSWLDYDFCEKKFFYSSVIGHYPVYESDFHQRLAFGIIAKLLSQLGGGRKEVREVLYPLFPQWTDTLKDNLIDMEYYRKLRDYKSFQNITYPAGMERLQRLRSRYVVGKKWKVKHRYKKDTLKPEALLKEWAASIQREGIRAQPGQHCRMCPHLPVCKEGAYVIDTIKD